jgi:acetolactate decarboxylase
MPRSLSASDEPAGVSRRRSLGAGIHLRFVPTYRGGVALTSRLEPSTADPAPPHAAFQTSTLQALADGDWHGHLTVGELRRRGSLGLGTCDALDGEMTVLDGQAWRARANGSIVRVADEERAPFAVVTAFVADTALSVRRPLEHAELLWTIRAVADELPGSFAIRFDGALDAVRARSVAPQYLPDRARSLVAATQQGHFTLGPTVGSLVGFSFARWADDFEPPGVHLHAITADRRQGGHVLRAQVGPGTLRFHVLTRPREEPVPHGPRST